MERITLVALLVVVPSAVFGQRIEVALLGGVYRPTPAAIVSSTGDVCDGSPCPIYVREAHANGRAVAARVTAAIGSRFGIDFIWHQAKGDATVAYYENPDGNAIGTTSADEYRVVIFTVQPHVRAAWSERFEATLGAGVSAVDHGPRAVLRDGDFGFAFSGSLRARLTKGVSVEARVNNAHLPGSKDFQNHLIAAAGLSFSLVNH